MSSPGAWAVAVEDVVYTVAGPVAEVVNCWTRAGWREHCSSTAPSVSREAFPFRTVTAGRFATLDDFEQWCRRWHRTQPRGRLVLPDKRVHGGAAPAASGGGR
ncbi:hypothetical protein [Salinifilum ghardaiensis]